jgi:enoyl-[acyl-carrier protein] reductase II
MKKFCEHFSLKYPIIQAGMVWCSGWKLAKASYDSGILGTLGAGSMQLETLKHHILQLKNQGILNFAVNIPLMYKHVNDQINEIIAQKVSVVITSAGNPGLYTKKFKDNGIKVLHVVSNRKFAEKAIESGVDGIIAEGFEAGGHNGREETTTLVLLQQLSDLNEVFKIAAGGFYNGASMLAAISLGADGIQIGSRLAAAQESSAHENYKNSVINAKEGDTILTLKELAPVRLIKNSFYSQVQNAYQKGASTEELKDLLGKGRAKLGIFEGDVQNGEIEVGQVSGLINKKQSVNEIISEVMQEYNLSLNHLKNLKTFED